MTGFNPINLNRLAVFVAVVETGSLTRAAERLGVAKTLVSKHIQRLETEVGANLLARTTRRVSVTDAGKRFYDACNDILRATERAILEVSQDKEQLQGVLRVAAPVDYGAAVVAPALVVMQRRHPGLRVELLSSDSRVDLVANGIDVAIRLGRLNDSSHHAARIGSYGKWLVASPDFMAGTVPPSTIAELEALPFVALSVVAKPLLVPLEGPAGEQLTLKFQHAFFANTAHACHAAVVAGGGIAVLSDFSAAEDIQAGRLVRLFADWTMPASAIQAVFPDATFRSPKVRAFIDEVKTYAAIKTPSTH
ncbi:LysR family transcriptional regulator [Undibacterium sp. TJN25]|uniref:LysR family transcriptional regulator n=1 Tax=Undibacterium sp. TJN25 TaxID=3413056 RepID=UPI003BF30417